MQTFVAEVQSSYSFICVHHAAPGAQRNPLPKHVFDLMLNCSSGFDWLHQ